MATTKATNERHSTKRSQVQNEYSLIEKVENVKIIEEIGQR